MSLEGSKNRGIFLCNMAMRPGERLGHTEKEISEVLLCANELQSEKIPCLSGRMLEELCLVPKKYLKW